MPPPPAGQQTLLDVTADGPWAQCLSHVEYLTTSNPPVVEGEHHPERSVRRDQMAVHVVRAFELPM